MMSILDRRLILVFLSTLIYVTVFGQSFYKEYDNNGHILHISNTISEFNGSLVELVTSNFDSEESLGKPKFTIYNSDSGEIEYSDFLPLSQRSSYSFHNVIYTDDFIYGIGVLNRKDLGGGIYNYDCLVLGVDYSGDILFFSNLGDDGVYEYGRDIAMNGNVLAITYNKKYTVGTVGTTTICRIDKDRGDTLWCRDIPKAYPEYTTEGIAIDDAGNIYTASEAESFIPTVQRRGVTKLDSMGNVIYTRYYDDDVIFSFCRDIEVLPNNEVVIAGYMGSTGQFNNYITKINPENGDVIWETIYDTYSSYNSRLTVLRNGNIARTYSRGGHTMLRVTNPDNGRTVFERTYDNDKIHQTGIAELSDGSLVLSGRCIGQDPCEYWMLRTNPDYTTSVEEVFEKQERAQLYPNPAIDKINISTLNKKIEEVIIRDIQGQVVRQKDHGGYNQIDVSELLPGLYFTELRYKGGQRELKKFIKQ